MKLIKILIAAILLTAGPVHADIVGFTNVVNDVIPDGNPTGLKSTIEVSGLFGEIQSLELTLEISGGYNGDLYAYLTGPNGNIAILLNRVGVTAGDSFGYSDAGFSITLDDNATTDIHTYGGNGGLTVIGTWQPDGRNVSPQLVSDTSERANKLDVFNGTNPNGTWTLFASDAAGDFESTLVSWGLRINVPEPAGSSLFVFGGVALTFIRKKMSSKHRRTK